MTGFLKHCLFRLRRPCEFGCFASGILENMLASLETSLDKRLIRLRHLERMLGVLLGPFSGIPLACPWSRVQARGSRPEISARSP
eukprot:5343073-Pyramimonas_sp.AAC.1